MTYLGFHGRFTVPVVVGLCAWIAFLPGLEQLWLSLVARLFVLCVVVVACTSPWDNAAVARGIWDFPSDRVWFRIKHLPIEEYAFFVIQTVIVALLTVILVAYDGGMQQQGSVSMQTGAAIVASILLWAAIGWIARNLTKRKPSLSYAWHLFFWCVPIVLIQWVIAPQVLASCAQAIAASTLVVGTYLSIADLVAIRHGIWFFDHSQTTGHRIAGVMPWEEAAFFYLTSLLVAQSVCLLLPPFRLW